MIIRRLLFAGLLFFVASVTLYAQEDGDSAGLGKIAFVGTDYNIYSYDLAGAVTSQLTDDGSSIRRYKLPTWSNNRQLAYFCCDVQTSGLLNAEIFVSPDGVEAGSQVHQGDNQDVIYASWSPQACDVSPDCHDLALLMNDFSAGAIALEVVRYSDGETIQQTRVGTGVPFYYSWSADGTEMILRRTNRIDVYSLIDEDNVQTVQQISNSYQAPAWSPVDNRFLYGAIGEGSQSVNLVMGRDGEKDTFIADISGFVSFSWAPNGQYVAYRVTTPDNAGPLFVIDAATGEIVSRTSIAGILAFFWSPDSQHVAYLTLSTPPGTFNAQNSSLGDNAMLAQGFDGFAWSVLNIENGQNQQYSAFLMTQEMLYMFQFFDQFNQSHSIWSPDSSHIVYSEITNQDDPQPVINIFNVTQPDTVPLTIAEGVFAVWSFN